MPPPATPPPPFQLDLGTGLSLALAFSFMPAAQLLASRLLPRTVSKKYYWIFTWCVYDFLTHSIIEGSYLYHCFVSYETISNHSDHPSSSLLAKGPSFLGYTDRNYGSYYSQGPMARLWREYAKADSRWGGSDLNVISLELLTVLLAGPAAAYICYLIARITNSSNVTEKARLDARMWFIAVVLSTGELYGGFMTFAPEWLSGNTALAGDDPIYLWLYLVFFNGIWVFVPAWILYLGYYELTGAFVNGVSSQHLRKVS
ncbi:hypothetical protein LTR64_002924 [Lithohypha guttulata]|uniref:uncharacterized protein n=1 Tax=Lithohypha guttulata TaxID=1690604 RepID=UPI00315D4F53